MTRAIPLRQSAQTFRSLARLHVRAQKAEVERHGIATSHCAIMAEVAVSAGLSLTELATRLQLDKGWVSRTVQRMVADGLLTRTVSREDRRVKALVLTAAGRRHHVRLNAVLDAQLERVLARLSSPEQARVGAALALLSEAYIQETSFDDDRDSVSARVPR